MVMRDAEQYPPVAQLNDTEIGELISSRLRGYHPWLAPASASVLREGYHQRIPRSLRCRGLIVPDEYHPTALKLEQLADRLRGRNVRFRRHSPALPAIVEHSLIEMAALVAQEAI